MKNFQDLSKEEKLLTLIDTREHLNEIVDNYKAFENPESVLEVETRAFAPKGKFGVGQEIRFGGEFEKKLAEINEPISFALYNKQKEAFQLFCKTISETSEQAAKEIQAEIDSLLK